VGAPVKRRLAVVAGIVTVLVMLAALVSIALSQRTIASEDQKQTKCAQATASVAEVGVLSNITIGVEQGGLINRQKLAKSLQAVTKPCLG
jgi:hypothetical protein